MTLQDQVSTACSPLISVLEPRIWEAEDEAVLNNVQMRIYLQLLAAFQCNTFPRIFPYQNRTYIRITIQSRFMQVTRPSDPHMQLSFWPTK